MIRFNIHPKSAQVLGELRDDLRTRFNAHVIRNKTMKKIRRNC